jgi:hypothetical protein
VRPHRWSVPAAGLHAAAGHGGLEFGGVDVHGGPREVGQPTDVVEVQVGLDDVAHVLGVETHGPDLADGGQ